MQVRPKIHVKGRLYLPQTFRLHLFQRLLKLSQRVYSGNRKHGYTRERMDYVGLHRAFRQKYLIPYGTSQMRPALRPASVLSVGTGKPAEFSLLGIIPPNL